MLQAMLEDACDSGSKVELLDREFGLAAAPPALSMLYKASLQAGFLKCGKADQASMSASRIVQDGHLPGLGLQRGSTTAWSALQ